MIFFFCLVLPGVVLCLPAAITIIWWMANGRNAGRLFPLAAVGVGLMGLSLVTLPWLNFSPLERIGLDWLYEVAPFVGRLLELFGIHDLDRLQPFWRAIGIRPPGWLALVLNAQSWIGLLGLVLTIGILGGIIFGLAEWTAFRRRQGFSAILQAVIAFVLLLLLLYHLPGLDGLGEHDFSNILALSTLVILNVHLSWLGPFIMMVGLAMVLVDGVRRLKG